MSETSDVLSGAQQTALDRPAEIKPENTQRAILEEALRIIRDSNCIDLEYPNESDFDMAERGKASNYEGGSTIRFVVLRRPGFLGREDVCVAVVDNRSTRRSMSLGRGVVQAQQGSHSEREIAITRLVQTPAQQLSGTGIYTRIVLSDTIQDLTGTLTTKGKVRREFIQRWGKGALELAPTTIYDAKGDHIDFEAGDYEAILEALRSGKPDAGFTQRVARSEQEFELARPAVSIKTQLSPVSQPPALKG